MTELTELGAQIETLTRELRRITALIQTPARRPSISWSDGDEYATADDTGDGWRLRGNNWGINVDRDLTDIECEYLRARTRRPYGVELFEAVALLDELREEGKNPADFIDRPIPQTAAQANVDPDSVDANRSEVGEEPNDTERGSRVAYEFLLGDLHLGEDALNPWKVPGKPLAAHRIVLARFDGGWPDWRPHQHPVRRGRGMVDGCPATRPKNHERLACVPVVGRVR